LNPPTALTGERIAAQAQALAFPRYPGTEGDARAIEKVAESFTAAGLEVAVEPFSYDLRPAWRALRGLLWGCAVALAAAGLLLAEYPIAAAALLVVALGAGGIFLTWAPGLERVYRRSGPTKTANITARRPSAQGVRTRGTVVVLAHHDSKSQNLILPVRMGATLVALAGTAFLTVEVVQALSGGVAPDSARWVALVTAVSLMILSTLTSGNHSPGGVDNAGSLAIVLALAQVLPQEIPKTVDLVFLSPGAEEDHMVGAQRWLDLHVGDRADLAPPIFALNLDGAGASGEKLVLISRFGFGRPFSPRLAHLARRAAAELGYSMRSILMPPAIGIDGIPFAHRGIECTNFSSGSLGRATLAVHSAGDVAENLDPNTLERSALWVREVVHRLAETLEGDADADVDPP
jgi:hypothetical protein